MADSYYIHWKDLPKEAKVKLYTSPIDRSCQEWRYNGKTVIWFGKEAAQAQSHLKSIQIT